MQFLPLRRREVPRPPPPSFVPPPMALPPSFRGTSYRLANLWTPYIPMDVSNPLRYAEVGAFYGANIITVAMTYGAHPDSELLAIDPWTDYSDYPEYKGQQTSIYETFCHNIAEYTPKIQARRGYSHEVLPTLEDGAYDLIYIDGNHEPEYVLEDAVLAFRKVKEGGYMVFDDYGWGGPDLTQRGIDAFLSGYRNRLRRIATVESQVFVQKVR
jgi:predicted O-methyltransferase YrrM